MPKVLFFSPYGSWTVHAQVDAILASALRARGVETKVVGCDGFFDKCYVLAHSKNKEADCAACAKRGKDFFSVFNLPLMQLRERFDFGRIEDLKSTFAQMEFDDLVAYEHRGTSLGNEILPTVCSYFRTTWKHINQPRCMDLYREYLAYGAMAFDAMTSILEEWGATALVMFNGVGYLHSPALLAARKLGVSVVCHERGVYESSYLFSSNATIGKAQGVVKQIESWQTVPLTIPEMSRVKNNFFDREAGRDSNLPGFLPFRTDPRTVRSYLNIPFDARIVSFFSSTEYEHVYVREEHAGVPSQKDVLNTLIESFRGRSEYLVIRHHPNIAGGRGGSPPEYDMLQWQFEQGRDLPPNVRIVMPAEKLNSYALLWHSDAVFAPHSSVRHEALARGIPTAAFNHVLSQIAMSEVVCSADACHIKNIVDNLLAKSWTLPVKEFRDLYRMACTFHFRNSINFRSIGIKDNFLPQINITSFEQLLAGNDPELDRICDHLIHGAPLLKEPGSSEMARDDADEIKFLTQELERVQSQRRSCLSQSITPAESKTQVLLLCVSELPEFSIKKRFAQPRQIELDVQVIKDIGDAEGVIVNSSATFVVVASDRMQFDSSWFGYAVEELTKQSDKIAIQCQVLSGSATLALEKYPEFKTSATVFKRAALLEKRIHEDGDSIIVEPTIRCVVDDKPLI